MPFRLPDQRSWAGRSWNRRQDSELLCREMIEKIRSHQNLVEIIPVDIQPPIRIPVIRPGWCILRLLSEPGPDWVEETAADLTSRTSELTNQPFRHHRSETVRKDHSIV